MEFFINVVSFDDLKKQYKTLAMKYHPDCGGSTQKMQELNAEYDRLFPIWKHKSKIVNTETASSTRNEFYTSNGWKGTKYESGRTTQEIAKLIREYVKSEYSDCKFSIRISLFSGGSEIYISLLEAPYQVFKDYKTVRASLNEYHLEKETRLVPEALQMFLNVADVVNSYRYDDSDSQIDYFCTNFYYSLEIGSCDHPFKVVKREKKKPAGRYETVTKVVTETRKVMKPKVIDTPEEIREGQSFIINRSLNYGISKGYVYKIQTVEDNYLLAFKYLKGFKKTTNSFMTRGNTVSTTLKEFKKLLKTGAVSMAEIEEVEETYTKEKKVRKPMKDGTLSKVSA